MPVSLNVASQVGEDLVHVVKTFSALRHHLSRLHPDVETTAYPLIFTLANGPMRVGAIAERIHSDMSTVSRQVSHLVQADILAKIPDPNDGRAQIIALAPDGERLLQDIHRNRGQMFASVMSDWTDDEARDFDGYLSRLHSDLTNDFSNHCAAASTGWAAGAGSPIKSPLIGKESM
ncbi:MarR family transcriptional regulator [Dermatophilaceae bacterium Sec6.4]